jgi:hypothetical protein
MYNACSVKALSQSNRCVLIYERLSDYIEGRKRYLHFKDKKEEFYQSKETSVKSTNATKEELTPFSGIARSSTKPFESARVLNKQSNTLGPKQLAEKLKDHKVCKLLVFI